MYPPHPSRKLSYQPFSYVRLPPYARDLEEESTELTMKGRRRRRRMVICSDLQELLSYFPLVYIYGTTPQRDEDKWWLPTVKVPPNGLSEASRKWFLHQKESVNQVLKAAMAINAQVLSEIEIPEDYIEALPKNGRESLGDLIYRYITVEYFDPEDFLSSVDLSTEHKVLDLKDRIEASIIIWTRKMLGKEAKSPWGSAIGLEKRELFEERAEAAVPRSTAIRA